MTRSGVTGIILAGGAGRRMGRPKPFIPWKGKPLIQWVYDAIKPVCEKVIIVANEGDFEFLDARVVPDNYPGQGPAAGIEAGLSAMDTDKGLVVSCDTPNLPTGLFRHLLSHHGGHEVTIASHRSVTEPLIGIYGKEVAGRFRSALEQGDPHPPRIIRNCRWQAVPVGPEDNFFSPGLLLNLNTPNDLHLTAMPQVTLLYFGSIRDITGLGTEKSPAPGTLGELHRDLLMRFPRLGTVRFRFSVNESLVSGDPPLNDGDVVALLPPFAGG